MQEHIWEREYKNPKLVTKEDKPQPAVLAFLKFLKKKEKVTLENCNILDLGSGTGRNANYIASLDTTNRVVGMEIAPTALKLAVTRAQEGGLLNVDYIHHSMGELYPFSDGYFDIALDVTSSNSLSEKERSVYLKETARVLRAGGYLFVRALCKDGDTNAKALLKQNPGKEKDTYIMPDLGLEERVFSKDDFVALYSPLFTILKLEKIAHYSKVNGRIYKRNYWLAYLKKENE